MTIRNHHRPSCGDPPIVNEDSRYTYIGYFESQHGEQWIFTCNRVTGVTELRGGDTGCNKPWQVVGGKVDGLNLNRAEML
ncbi:hypothetical protein [Rubinisphaera sp.]|uniref:hypothetical protein n=1 Tax=Rubinisphaera sp. TaxID=2024857 RepID=UPI000C0ECCE8|nr:hypothetical protein [Rubinisphaera sp.]MBV08220.1 hypothetical protein [Rubinisphaera sp.]HCS52591.1 hypothetical protein [Planctomycetaceae bacterium]